MNMSTCTMFISRWVHRICCEQEGNVNSQLAMFWSFSQAIALKLTSYCDMLFAGSTVPPTGSCRRGMTPQSRYTWHLLTLNQVFFAINCELSVFSWLMATCVVWQMKSNVRQFTLVKHCVWLDLSASYNKFLIMVSRSLIIFNLSQSNYHLVLMWNPFVSLYLIFL